MFLSEGASYVLGFINWPYLMPFFGRAIFYFFYIISSLGGSFLTTSARICLVLMVNVRLARSCRLKSIFCFI